MKIKHFVWGLMLMLSAGQVFGQPDSLRKIGVGGRLLFASPLGPHAYSIDDNLLVASLLPNRRFA